MSSVVTEGNIPRLSRAISRPNAERALRRLSADLQTLIERSPKVDELDKVYRGQAAYHVRCALMALRELYTRK